MKFRFFNDRWFLTGLRWVLGLVFLYAGIVKWRAPQDFADSIASFWILPSADINVLVLSLPPFEILTAVLLLTGWRKRAAALAVMGMTSVFAAALAAVLAEGLNVDCGCFGGGTPSRFHTWTSLGRDLLLLLAATLLYWKHSAPTTSLAAATPKAANVD